MAKRLYIQLYSVLDGESITLPLNPDTTDIIHAIEIKIQNILGYGEVSIPGYHKLIPLTLSNIFPDDDTHFALLASLVKQLNYKIYSLQGTVDMVKKWVDNKRIIRVIIPPRLNLEFRIQSFTEQVRESVPDLGYTIELIEYRNPEGEAGGQPPESNLVKLKKRIINKYIPAQLTGQTGQTIYKLAKLTYGDKWQELAQKNNITDANIEIAGQIINMLPIK